MLHPYIEAVELRDLARKGEIRPLEVADFFIARIERLNPRYGAFFTTTFERARDDARRLEAMARAEADHLPLFGVPYSIKDLIWTKDIPTTFGSKNFEHFYPPADAELVVRLARSGGIMMGKTTTPEFGTRATTEGGLHPAARNPWNPEHTAGGSSGGAAAAVGCGMHPLGQASDGGGSIRIPAACCGLVGLKPSRGRVTMAPASAEGWGGLSTSGPIARSVRDAALMLDVMAGPVAGDPYAAWPPARPFFDSATPVRGKLKLAYIRENCRVKVESETLAAFDAACDVFRDLGHSVEPVAIDPCKEIEPFARIIVGSNVGALDIPNPDLLDPIVRGTWEWGRKISATDYIRAINGMHTASRGIVQALMPYDALLAPTLTRPAVKVGSLAMSPATAADEVYDWIAFTFPFNSTGQPSISLPNGFCSTGLPLAFQIVGRPNDESTIISIAAQFEESRPWKHRHPPLD
jgi:Asp-tRNA(Asn)/Glu-tRNA(Gln) amidotransferase A subunit family amidase